MLVSTQRFGKLRIAFRHEYNRKGHPRSTECIIKTQPDDPNSNEGFYGIQNCHSADQFNKETGRCMSLQNALDQLTRDKYTQTEIWMQYYVNKLGAMQKSQNEECERRRAKMSGSAPTPVAVTV